MSGHRESNATRSVPVSHFLMIRIIRKYGRTASLLGRNASSCITCPENSLHSFVGTPRIELGPYPPHGQILPLYYVPDEGNGSILDIFLRWGGERKCGEIREWGL